MPTPQFYAPKIQPRQTYINREQVVATLTKYCNDMTIRLTPNEFDALVELYIQRYINVVNKEAVVSLVDIIINSK